MTATEAAVPRKARERPAAWPAWFRVWLFVLLGLSTLFVANDAMVALQQGRADLAINCLARVVMIVIAGYGAVVTRGDPNVKLLVPGLIGASFDVHWQTAYFDAPGMFEAAMVVKFIAVPIGLTYLLRLTARFGGGRLDPVRRRLDDWAPAIAGLLACAGLAHGALEIANCQVYDGRCILQPNAWLDITRDAYLVLDAAIRVAMIVATVVGIFTSWNECRERLFFMVLGTLAYAAGTAIEFSAYVLQRHAFWLALTDAVLTAAFPILLLWAVKKKQLFDIQFVVIRISLIGIVAAIAVPSVVALDQLIHFLLSYAFDRLSERVDEVVELPGWLVLFVTAAFDIGIGTLLFFRFRPLEERVTEWVHDRYPSTRGQRIEALRALGDALGEMTDPAALAHAVVETIHTKGSAAFALLFGRHADGRFVPLAASPGPPPPPLATDLPIVRTLQQARKPVRCEDSEAALAGAKLAVPMVLGGTLYGILACGRKAQAGESELDYDPEEEKALCAVARAAAGTLLALHMVE